MRMRHAVGLVIALALLLAGCGDDGGDKGSASGTGYSLKLAPGWKDATKNAKGSVIRFDLLIGKDGGGAFNTNVNIIREEVPDGTTLEDLRRLYRGQLSSVGAVHVTPTRKAAIDGDDAFTYEYDQKTPAGDAVHGRQVAVLHDGHAHTITLTVLATKFDSANQDFSTMLRSWQWK
jgi:hypothetical protein